MRFFVLFLLLSLLLAVPFLLWGEFFETSFSKERTLSWFERCGPWAWAAGVALLAADLVLPVPSTAVMAALGVVYGTLLGGLIGAAGSFFAGLLAYGLSRAVGERAAIYIVGEKDLDRGKTFFATAGGGWAVALSRWLPLLPEVIACLAGLARMPLPRFCAALLCGSLPMALVFAGVGASGRESPWLAVVLSAVLPLVLWPLAARLLRSRVDGVDGGGRGTAEKISQDD